jgi:hypothetical protein
MGGVAIYIREAASVDVEEIDVSNANIELVCEVAFIKINIQNKTLYILGIYRPPGGQVKLAVDTISHILAALQAETKSVILIGDINIDRLTNNTDNKYFEDELLMFGARRLPLPATRITSRSRTSIDCICTSVPEESISFKVVQAGISDHTGQICTVEKQEEAHQKSDAIQKRIFSRRNLDRLKEEFAKESWETVQNALNVEEAYDLFQTTVRRILDHVCPSKKTRSKPRGKLQVQYDEEAKLLKEEFLYALHRFELTGNDNDKAVMVTKKKAYDLKLRDLKRSIAAEYVNSSENKSKAVWHIINAAKQSKQKEDPNLQIEIEGKLVEDPIKIAKHLNSYFAKIANETLDKNREQLKNTVITHPILMPQSNLQPLHLTPTTFKEVLSVISSLKSKLSCGVDEIPSKVVKHCALQLAAPLVSIINKSFGSGHFPSSLKIAKIYPKYKKGSHTKPENYRPISLISTFSKIIEKIALTQMVSHLERHDLIAKSQHGFLKGRSTTTALTTLFERIIDHLEDRKHVSAVLLDYSKAFDCLGHDLILKKLSTMGIGGLAKEWVASYLKGRRQIVEIQQKVNGSKHIYNSGQLSVSRGVPQGSVLGPFLFILFTNDFSSFINDHNIETVMYADDTTLLFTNHSAQELQRDVLSSTNKATQYCLQNDLAINPSKTTQINFSRRHEQIPVTPDITVEQNTKLLGVTIDADLSWTDHINNLTKKLSSGVYVVKRMRWTADLQAAKTAYFAVVESHIRYGLLSWGGTSEANLNRILVLQKKAVRALAGLGTTDSCREAFKSLKLLTVVALYIHAAVLYTDQLDLPRNWNFHKYNTRRAADYSLPAHHTTQFSKKPSYIGQKIVNVLPQDLKNMRGNKLKRHLQDWLIEHPVYSLKEFFEII